MSNLQGVLAVLLGAEAEAEKIVSDSRDEAASLLHKTQDDFARERTTQMSEANERARAILDSSLQAGKTEAEQLVGSSSEEKARIQKSFDENADRILSEIVNGVAEYYITKIRGAQAPCASKRGVN